VLSAAASNGHLAGRNSQKTAHFLIYYMAYSYAADFCEVQNYLSRNKKPADVNCTHRPSLCLSLSLRHTLSHTQNTVAKLLIKKRADLNCRNYTHTPSLSLSSLLYTLSHTHSGKTVNQETRGYQLPQLHTHTHSFSFSLSLTLSHTPHSGKTVNKETRGCQLPQLPRPDSAAFGTQIRLH